MCKCKTVNSKDYEVTIDKKAKDFEVCDALTLEDAALAFTLDWANVDTPDRFNLTESIIVYTRVAGEKKWAKILVTLTAAATNLSELTKYKG